MTTIRTLFKYWHYGLFATLIAFSIARTRSVESVRATLSTGKNVKATLAISKPESHHLPYRDWAKVHFEQSVAFSDSTVLQQDKFSAWYKIHFEHLPKNSALNFLQYETVIGFDEKGHELPQKISETGSNTNQHKRNLVFELSDTPPPERIRTGQYATYYFKVFARKQQGSDSLQIKLQDLTTLNNSLAHDFYDNQTILMWLVFLLGIGFFQTVYISGLAWSRRKPEYYYYLAFCIVGLYYMFIARRFELGYLGNSHPVITSSILTYFVIMFFFYARFVRYYLDTKYLDTFTDQQFRKGEWFMLVGAVVNLLIYLFTYDLEYTFCFFIPFTSLIIVLTLYLLILTYRLRMPSVKYLMAGAVFMIATTTFRLVYAYLEQTGVVSGAADIDAFGTMLGGVIDGICLNLGLNYKHRLENIEKQRALETIRNSIASDLHDDLGSGLSTIRVLSEMAKKDIQQPEKKNQIERIAQQANDLIERMATIIWAMNTENDTVESLINYLQNHTTEFLEALDVSCSFSIPVLPPSVLNQIILGETRRQVFFAVKEILNNIVKHAEATEVKTTITFSDNTFEIRIADNGKGFDTTTPKNGKGGNGLKNICERLKAIGGE